MGLATSDPHSKKGHTEIPKFPKIRSKFCSDVLKENYCLIKVYFVLDQFSVNGVFLFCFVLFVGCFFYPLPICSQGEGNLISRFSPGAGAFGMI